jgi:hypothetical protein
LPVSSAKYEDLCESIFDLDQNIRFAGIIGKMGKLVAGGMRKGIESLEPKEERRKLYLEYALRTAMRQDFDSTFGRVIYTLTERERVKLASFPMGEQLVLVSIDRKGFHDKIIRKVLDLVSAD